MALPPPTASSSSSFGGGNRPGRGSRALPPHNKSSTVAKATNTSGGSHGRSNSYLQDAQVANGTGNGTFLLILLNLLVFAADHLLHWRGMQALYLNHMQPHWWQFATCCFAHASWQHLSSNLFSLLIFGKIVEEEGGAFGVWFTYLVCGVGGAAASYLSQSGQPIVSLGASGAVFGLFMVGVLTKLQLSPRKLVEAFVLGQFVVQQLVQEVSQQAAVMSGRHLSQVSHVAHLGGALVGVLLVWALSRLPDVEES